MGNVDIIGGDDDTVWKGAAKRKGWYIGGRKVKKRREEGRSGGARYAED